MKRLYLLCLFKKNNFNGEKKREKKEEIGQKGGKSQTSA